MFCPMRRLACRDIGGSDPERMAAPRVAEYVEELFKKSPVQVARNVVMCANRNCHFIPQNILIIYPVIFRYIL